ncbi:hypothetical protein PV10_06091 [Exophiala mesophila]|uniref:Uncharacterized protein n=1 Tax=Exophiala mesophila TaxID=212818 RepID=A0A0D1ZA77_EXOME|nr:uncharacterized protein PV10_06091 [Exophiala mesophila]KIV91567.1 hypothetical protein PV10_06091 [Exophiala mesophila]
MLWHWSSFFFLLYPYTVFSTEQKPDFCEKQPLISVDSASQRHCASLGSSPFHKPARCAYPNAQGLEDLKNSEVKERLLDALYDFSDYEQGVLEHIERIQWLYTQFTPDDEKETLERVIGYSTSFARVKRLIAHNSGICQDIVASGLATYGLEQSELNDHIQARRSNERKVDRGAVSQALKHLVRDWAPQGDNERNSAFPLILDTILEHFPSTLTRDQVQVLVPGAGLGRLAHEIAALGPHLDVTANEFSMHVNLVYRYLENNKCCDGPFTIYPFLENWSHHRRRTEIERPITVPDTQVDSSAVTLIEGDFTAKFNDASQRFDAVVTLFFIDTARDMLQYLKCIRNVLRPGGLWINFGPLLFMSAPFMQLSLEEIILVSQDLGFEFLETTPGAGELTLEGYRVWSYEAPYNFNSSALNKFAYHAQFWVARRLG